jgi:hypothetical protein
MSLRSSSTFRVFIPFICALALVGCATADGSSRRMLDLNRQALGAFEAGKLTHARDLLIEAVTVGKKGGLTKHNTMARTYLDLGAVYLAMNDREKGLRNLGLALRIEPDLQPSAQIATTPVKKALSSARAELKRRRGQAGAKDKDDKDENEQTPPPPPKREAPVPAPRAVVKATPPPAPKPAPQPKTKASVAAVAKAAPPPPPPAPPPPPPEPKAVAPVVAAAPLPDDEEPDLPANVPQPLYCPTPDEAPPAEEMALRCVPRPGVAVSRMVLFYRSAGSETFTPVPMIRSHKGWYSGLVPASAVIGKSLQYYVEAQSPGKKATTTSNGQSDSPNLVSIRPGAALVGHGTLAAAHFKKESTAGEVKEDNPLLEAERARERVVVESTDHRRRSGALFFGASLGSGWGWHPRRVLEFRTGEAVETGFSPGTLLQVTPEIGLQLDQRYAFSVQSRHQFIPESGSGDLKAGHPKHSAWAVFARAYRFIGSGNAQIFLTGTVGGGQGFRLVVPPHPLMGVTRNDTVRGGPIVLGPGLGFLYHITSHFAWVAEGRLLAGVPDLAALGELSTGGQVAF